MKMALSAKDHRLLRLFVATVLGRWDEVTRVRLGAPAGEPDRAWREAVLQVHLFAGIPRQVEAYEVLERAGGLGDATAEGLAEPDLPERGWTLFNRIYGPNATHLARRLEGFHPDFGRFVQGHAYGRVLTRPGLEADRRELLGVAALAALGQDRQLASHARGSVECGASREEVFEALEVVADLIDPELLGRARQVVERFARPW